MDDKAFRPDLKALNEQATRPPDGRARKPLHPTPKMLLRGRLDQMKHALDSDDVDELERQLNQIRLFLAHMGSIRW